MNLAHQIPRGLKCTVRRTCIRRQFSSGILLQNFKQDGSILHIPPPDSTSFTSVKSKTIKAPNQQFADLFEAAFRDHLGGRNAKIERPSASDFDAFQPALLEQMPLQNPQATSTTNRSLPQPQISKQSPGYFYVHGVSVTKNIHVTICDYKHNPVIAISAGQLGKKHSKRQTPEAAFETAVKAFERLANSKYQIQQVELVLKGFGPGRRGFLQAITSPQGEFVRRRVVR